MKKYLNDSIKFLDKLISFKSIKDEPVLGGPFGLENKRALEYSLSILEKLGGTTKNLDGYVGFADFFPEKEIKDENRDVFGILLHLDVVPVDDNWNSDPFVLTQKDGKLFGRGTVDDKGPFAAILFAFKKLLDEGLKLQRQVRFILGCDEESGWGCMNHYKKHEAFPSFGIAPDAAFPVINYEKGILRFLLAIPKPSGIIEIQGGDRSNIVAPWCNVIVEKPLKGFDNYTKEKNGYLYKIKGKGAHASTPKLGVNAIEKLLTMLEDEYSDLKPIVKLAGPEGLESITNEKYEKSDYFHIKLTSNIGKVSSDDEFIYFTFDIRYPKEISPGEILSLAKKEGEVFQDTVVVKTPLFVDEETPLVKTLVAAYEKATGKKGKAISIGGGTYARALPLAVSCGPNFEGEEELAHMANEYISIKNLEMCIKIYYLALKEILFKK